MRGIITVILGVMLTLSSYAQVKDWARTDRFAADNAGVQVRPRAVFMGDSITEQWAVKDGEFFDSNNFLGRGISGQTSCQMLIRFRQDVIDLKPKYVVIMCGTNDIAENLGPVSLEVVMDNIKSMCELAILHRIRPILCSVTPCDHYRWRKELTPAAAIIKLNEMIRSYASDNRIRYVDYHALLDDGQGACRAEYTTDRCHLNLEGYKILESEILRYVK